MSAASVVVIGNEILTGKFADENGPYFVRRFRTLGVDLVRLVVIRDVVDEIADEVARCAQGADHVFTTGGVGPTHDDRTFEGVAAAFDLPLRVDPRLVEIMEGFGMEATDANLRMATVPEGAELVLHPTMPYPVIRVRNVWVLPGVPQLVKQKFEVIAPQLAGEAVRCVRIYANDHESEVASLLAGAQAAHPAVEIGSYPRFHGRDHRLIVTLEARDEVALAAAVERVRQGLDVVRLEGP
ncbi:MAG: competence/damage-inducible protein A [Alphaproteobacteria bacterium]|nr:competence/damage-inducible protein A [Alphaproteobacteria bacterium]